MATKSKVTFELDTVKYQSTDIVISKPAADAVAQRFYDQVMEGEKSPTQIVEFINFVASVGDALKNKEDIKGKNKWVDLVREEIEKNGEKGKFVSKYGTKFSLQEVATKYDYTKCGDPIWTNLNAQIEELKEKIKVRETFLKSLTTAVQMSFPDPSTGELLENVNLFPPVKSSTSSYKTELLKD